MSDSVTGSEPPSDEEMSDEVRNHACFRRRDVTYRDWDRGVKVIEREAVDAFIRDELPGLLATVLRDDNRTGSANHAVMHVGLNNMTRAGQAIAAKIAELRK